MALTIFSMVGLALAQSAIVSMHFQKQAEIGNLAKNLAVSKVEELSGVPLSDLDDSYDQTESSLSVSGHEIKFTRNTNITVNADNSRTVAISVASISPWLSKTVNYTTRFAPWE